MFKLEFNPLNGFIVGEQAAGKNEYGFEQDSALDELKKRAKNNPDLKRKLIENGLINE